MTDQRIKCTVSECMHNSVQDSSCRLKSINVSPCSSDVNKDPKASTACLSYKYDDVQHNEKYY